MLVYTDSHTAIGAYAFFVYLLLFAGTAVCRFSIDTRIAHLKTIEDERMTP
jgi:hypothetical protein